MEIKKDGKKMKIVGYSCLIFSAIIAILDLTGIGESDNTMMIMQFWAGTGITLLFGNAAKRIIGGTQINKQNGTAK